MADEHKDIREAIDALAAALNRSGKNFDVEVNKLSVHFIGCERSRYVYEANVAEIKPVGYAVSGDGTGNALPEIDEGTSTAFRFSQ